VALAASVMRLALRGLYETQIPRMAAALAYRTIFSIIPVLVISLLVFGALISDQQVKFGVERLLEFTGLNQIAIDGADAGFVGPPGPAEIAAWGGGAGGAGPAAVEGLAQAGRLDQLIADLVRRVNQSLAKVPSASIAIVSALVLIYAALSMLVELERAFNTITGAPSGRPWLKRLILYWAVLTLGTLLLGATFAVGDIFKSWALSLAGQTRAAAAVVGFLVTVVISTLLLLVAYVTVPNTRVALKPALAGAVVAAVLWELGKWAFRSYLDYSAGYARFYGSLAILPLFLLWIYVTWMIVLLGLQVAHGMASLGRWREALAHAVEGGSARVGPREADPAVALGVGAALARAFRQGRGVTPGQAGDEAGIPAELAGELLDAMADRGLAHRVVGGNEDETGGVYALARPPASVPAAELLAVVGGSGPGTGLGTGAGSGAGGGVRGLAPAVAERLVSARVRSLEGVTLDDLGGSGPDVAAVT
jgi:membrane protein